MHSWPCTLAALLYLLPIAVLQLWRTRSDRAAWEIALDVPFAVSVDLLGILLLARFTTLEHAVVMARLGWLACLGALVIDRVRRGKRVFDFPKVPAQHVAGAVIAAGLAFVLSYKLSRPYAIWDRELHIPTVSSLRGQTIPFATAYEPGAGFHYHFAGDVLASVMQVLSFDTLHASLALSLAHDIVFALTAGSVALLMTSFGFRRAATIATGGLAMLLMGPCVLHGKLGEPYLGYSYYAPLIWGFRPHQHLASLLLLGCAGTIAVRLAPELGAVPTRRTAPVLLASTALLALTDESSAGVLGLALGVAWLFDPRVVADTRKQGLLVFAGLAAAMVVPNVLFGAALSPGSPVQTISWVPLRSPGVQRPPLPLSSSDGRTVLFFDVLPILFCMLALIFAPEEERRSRAWGLPIFVLTLFIISVLGLTGVEINHAPPESHRFLTASLFIIPLFAILFWHRMSSAVLLWVVLGDAAAIFSTLLWLSHYSSTHCTPETYFRQRGHDLHAADCRVDAGMRFGELPKPTYIESSIWYYFAGCYPVYSAGRRVDYWTMKLYPELQAGFAELSSSMVAPGETIDAICPAGRAIDDVDRVCSRALAAGHCRSQGAEFVRCTLSPMERLSLAKE